MSNAGFVHQGANGNAVLRWWPIIAVLLAQVAGAAVIAYRVEVLSCDVNDIKTTMVTKSEWNAVQQMRVDQIGGLRGDVSEVKRRLEGVEKAVR